MAMHVCHYSKCTNEVESLQVALILWQIFLDHVRQKCHQRLLQQSHHEGTWHVILDEIGACKDIICGSAHHIIGGVL